MLTLFEALGRIILGLIGGVLLGGVVIFIAYVAASPNSKHLSKRMASGRYVEIGGIYASIFALIMLAQSVGSQVRSLPSDYPEYCVSVLIGVWLSCGLAAILRD